jgi:eukaryotic-like serine/threonine-protein kinase
MNAPDGSATRKCPRCESTQSSESFAASDHICPRCGLQVAHLEWGSPGAPRRVLGWLRGKGDLLHGRYKMTGVLGCGGFAAAYVADDQLLKGKRWALKEIPNSQYDQSEADLLSRLSHPAIPDIADRFESNGMVYLALKFGGDLTLQDERKRRGGTVPLAVIVAWTRQLTDSKRRARNSKCCSG